MQRLIENKLIYGQLLEVSEPHLVERYNQALEGLSLKKVELDKFRIDMTGYSPEVAGCAGRSAISRSQQGEPALHHPDAGADRPAGGQHRLFQHGGSAATNSSKRTRRRSSPSPSRMCSMARSMTVSSRSRTSRTCCRSSRSNSASRPDRPPWQDDRIAADDRPPAEGAGSLARQRHARKDGRARANHR